MVLSHIPLREIAHIKICRQIDIMPEGQAHAPFNASDSYALRPKGQQSEKQPASPGIALQDSAPVSGKGFSYLANDPRSGIEWHYPHGILLPYRSLRENPE